MTETDKKNAAARCACEIERKFLIRYPDISVLSSQLGVKIKKMAQTYLKKRGNASERVRKIVDADGVRFVYTKKTRVSDTTALEEEHCISYDEYEEYIKMADKARHTIEKTRYSFPCGSHIAEIDIYGFWTDRAILEIELADENEEFEIPSCVAVIKEVTHDKRYKNADLARSVIFDEI